MSKRRHKNQPKSATENWRPNRWQLALGLLVTLLLALYLSTEFESYNSQYDAEYVGSESCGDCHTIIYDQWQESPHAKMTRLAAAETIVGDFNEGSWTIPVEYQKSERDKEPTARMYRQGEDFYMALRDPDSGEYVPFKIEYAIGYQYRQTYLTREAGGVLRRLPLQWSVERQEFFPYWNYQEGSEQSAEDLWVQMRTLNSAWNLFCARCHTTSLTISEKDANHTYAVTDWVDNGIACEACHGAGSQHVNYFEHNYVNRVVAAINSRVRGEPVAYIANAPKMGRGENLSVCARCHGADILLGDTDIYRIYEPGYSSEGRINDLSHLFQSVPLEPGRTFPTVEVYADGRPKGIGMLFRSFIESDHYVQSQVQCYHCHQPHNNGEAVRDGLLEPSEASNNYCLNCHGELADNIASHSNHSVGESGSFCQDCHMPRNLSNIVTGTQRWTRSHTLSSIPDPAVSLTYGYENAPNACNECHSEESPQWALEWVVKWYGPNSNN